MMKWIFRLIGLVVVIVAILLGALFFLPGDRIAKIAADQITSMTGRQVEMSGDTRLSFYPVLGISTGQVSVANANWSDGGPMLTADSFKVGVDPSVLFGGDIRITGLEAVNPVILLERAADGRVNWELGVEGVAPSGTATAEKPAKSKALALTLDRALITGATLKYVDHGTGQQTNLPNSDFDLRWPAYQGEATFDAILRPAGEQVQISGQLGTVANFIEGGVSEMKAAVAAPGGAISFDGRGASLPQLTGTFIAELDDTARFLRSLGLSGIDIPQGLGRALAAKGEMTITEDMKFSLRDGALQLDQNRLSVAADVDLAAEKPRISAQLRAARLDLSMIADGNSTNAASGGGGSAGGGGATTTGTAVQTGWPKDPIDASALGLVDGEVALVADSLDFGTFNFGKTRILTTIDRSRAVFDLRQLKGYGGIVIGKFVVNNRNGLSVRADMAADKINLKPLLTDAAGITRFSTTGTVNVSVLGVGQNVNAIMNSLEGTVAVKTGNGHISGFDLDKLMRSGDGTGGTTVFDSMSAIFALAGGQMHNNDMRMSMPLAQATGKGRIGLGPQDVDYRFTPVVLTGNGARGLAIPVRIHGPWSSPRISADLEKAVDLNLKEEKNQLKDELKKIEEDVVNEIFKIFE